MTIPDWLEYARTFKGVKEIPGPKHNAVIIGWAVQLGGWVKAYVTNDDAPWCGLFPAHVFQKVLPGFKRPANPLSALAWGKVGVPILMPSPGAILTFKRPGGGHVGFYEGEDATHYHVLGGNQGNAVSIARIEKNRLVAQGIRWPDGEPLPTGGRVWLNPDGAPVTTNEA